MFSEEVSMQNLIRQFTLFTCRDLLEILIMGSLGIIVILWSVLKANNNDDDDDDNNNIDSNNNNNNNNELFTINIS